MALRNMVVELAFFSILCVAIIVANKFTSLGHISLRWIWHTDITSCQTCISLGNACHSPCSSSRWLLCIDPLTRPKLDSTKMDIWSMLFSFLATLLLRALLEMEIWISEQSVDKVILHQQTNT